MPQASVSLPRRPRSRREAPACLAQPDLLLLLGNSGEALPSGALSEPSPALSRAALLHAIRPAAEAGGAVALSKCGFGLLPGQHAGLYREASGAAKLRGVPRCKNGSLCPVCGPAVAATRHARLMGALKAHGGRQLLVCLTVQHSASDTMAGTIGDLYSAWRHLVQARWWREQVGAAYSRGFDFTIGQNGPHPHFHLVLCPPAGVDSDASALAFGAAFLAEWSRVCALVGRLAPDFAQDCQLAATPSAAASYCLKATANTVSESIVSEVVSPASKGGRAGLTIGDLIVTIAAGGARGESAARMFADLARSMKGRRAVASSASLKVDLNDLSSDDVSKVGPEAVAVAMFRSPAAIRVIWSNIRQVEAAIRRSPADAVEVLGWLLGPPGLEADWYLPVSRL